MYSLSRFRFSALLLAGMLLALFAAFQIAPRQAHADSFPPGCNVPVSIVAYEDGTTVIGTVTKECFTSGYAYAYVVANNNLARVDSILALMKTTPNVTESFYYNVRSLSSPYVSFGGYYPACGQIVGYSSSGTQLVGYACTP